MFEYQALRWLEYDRLRILERLNKLGAENWQPAFVIGGTIILCRTIVACSMRDAIDDYVAAKKEKDGHKC